MRFLSALLFGLTLGGTAAEAGEFDLDCTSFGSCLSLTGCVREPGETLHLREPTVGKPVFYWESDTKFEAIVERNGALVTLWATGAGSEIGKGTSLQTLVFSGATEAVYSTASYVEGLGFLWTRNQLTCQKVTS